MGVKGMGAVGVTGEWDDDLTAAYDAGRLRMTRVAYLITGRGAVAEEIVHDSFIAAQRSWSTVTNPNAYLRAAVVNRSRSWLRRRRLERNTPFAAPDSVLLGADELWDALGRLPERRRTVIVLRFYDDLPDAEIAGLLGCRPATVRTLVHRALHDLRREFDDLQR